MIGQGTIAVILIDESNLLLLRPELDKFPALPTLTTLDIRIVCVYYTHMHSQFDPKKNAANLAKHGISLADAEPVLSDTMALTAEDESAEGEARFVTIGMDFFGRLLYVVWTQRGEDVRFISARRADKKEREAYEQGN